LQLEAHHHSSNDNPAQNFCLACFLVKIKKILAKKQVLSLNELGRKVRTERLVLLVLALMLAKTNKKTCCLALHCCLTLSVQQWDPTREYPGEKPGAHPSAGCMVANDRFFTGM
jgi:hypothetical protein